MEARRLSLLPASMRARSTLIIGSACLIFLAIIGAGIDFLVTDRIEAGVFRDAQRTATNWVGSMAPGQIPRPAPEGRIDLLQLVDDHGRVVMASPAAAGRPPLGTIRPPKDNRIQDGTVCRPEGGCVMFTVIRLPPLDTSEIFGGESHFVYSGTTQPSILAGHRLELVTTTGVLLASALVAWGNWWVGGRALRPVAAIRATMADITVSDLSMRVPEPPGRTEYALLARTANQTLARLEEAVRQQRRFASTTSHELRTPLTGLRARLEEAVLYPGDVDPRQTIRDALTLTQRLETIVEDLLVLARLRSGTPAQHEPVDLAMLVREAIATLPADGVPICVRAQGDITVHGNRIQLVRVLDNLLANARRHAHGKVEVTVGHQGDRAVVAVTDDGDGIAHQDRERVFERFVRLEDGRRLEPGGSGLGLAISRDIAHGHDGTLRVEDSPRGARFVLDLPLLDMGDSSPPTSGDPPGVAGFGALPQTPAWRA
ncbi:HAMP domain-containing sensor histidine kinase [Sphaerisporangium sp. NPDC005289]|uniref:sensor histidine kinase n=1 Tax=Sphaerisporangium sp. NPDC005289 TaxID=3155247 RepID=UPI0033A17961